MPCEAPAADRDPGRGDGRLRYRQRPTRDADHRLQAARTGGY
ncbi:hypothetical protein XccvBFoX4_gp48 [Xanthomonas phage FoX4]|uniref:Uncharacterized protein n=1 Tax=Xanthomonas phage FoX4 TaxID=2723900 RepID=A0A858WJ32_9CAUD|nr:hypothetical protein KNU97_gp48 [Xanthomonas phage FoX4]QJI53002.1 hypothetical protein XccvBFoX4_gp48 [Xanthomonas phage FoX4]